MDLDVYAGPFDVLLGMIADRRLELTEIALSRVTDEFLAYARGLDFTADMDEASAFLDVAAVLVEAKSAALLPAEETGDGGDASGMEALRERDLLFARLLQYRAYKNVAADFRARLAANGGSFAHPGIMDDAVSAMLPDLVWTTDPADLAMLAARVFADAPASEVSVHQLHVPLVDLRAQARLVRDRLRGAGDGGSLTFAELISDASDRAEVVARFLAVLMFFKQGTLQFRQDGPYRPLHLRWMPGAGGDAGMDLEEGDFA
ncbi:segregation and condensation protein A [Bifidobacterium saguinibicoloris]|uniref:segregation and condensation protein A n=1 Tax=Bifidobacterium saguinibicoloris TaxID=2834433 RepID=UPI003B83052D